MVGTGRIGRAGGVSGEGSRGAGEVRSENGVFGELGLTRRREGARDWVGEGEKFRGAFGLGGSGICDRGVLVRGGAAHTRILNICHDGPPEFPGDVFPRG